MEIDSIIKNIRAVAVEGNLDRYKRLFSETKTEEATDPYWKEALKLYNSLNDVQRETLFKVIQQVQVDTLSTLFSYIDGVALFEDQKAEFALTYDNKVVSGYLLDDFLELDEDMQDD